MGTVFSCNPEHYSQDEADTDVECAYIAVASLRNYIDYQKQ